MLNLFQKIYRMHVLAILVCSLYVCTKISKGLLSKNYSSLLKIFFKYSKNFGGIIFNFVLEKNSYQLQVKSYISWYIWQLPEWSTLWCSTLFLTNKYYTLKYMFFSYKYSSLKLSNGKYNKVCFIKHWVRTEAFFRPMRRSLVVDFISFIGESKN